MGPKKTKSKGLQDENPLQYEVQQLRKKIKHWETFFSTEDSSTVARLKQYHELYDHTEDFQRRYAWAIPCNRSLNILANFSPLLEIGAGRGYWASILRNKGVDIVSYDKFVYSKKGNSNCFTTVLKGGPSKILLDEHCSRTLFLCYPDENESMAIRCLENYKGEYIVHVGELIHTGTMSGQPIAPFGRTSSAEFQCTLTASFHCLLVAELETT